MLLNTTIAAKIAINAIVRAYGSFGPSGNPEANAFSAAIARIAERDRTVLTGLGPDIDKVQGLKLDAFTGGDADLVKDQMGEFKASIKDNAAFYWHLAFTTPFKPDKFPLPEAFTAENSINVVVATIIVAWEKAQS
jgi:hypothetical protein